MGTPKSLKNDNRTAYVSSSFATFCRHFKIYHKTGIPYNPEGQGIVEKFNHLLKTQLKKIKRGT